MCRLNWNLVIWCEVKSHICFKEDANISQGLRWRQGSHFRRQFYRSTCSIVTQLDIEINTVAEFESL